jgi:hypothetical protein
MYSYNFFIILAIFVFSCQSSSQDQLKHNESTSDEMADSIKKIEKEDIGYYADSADIAIYEKLIKYATDKNLAEKSISEIEMEIAKELMGTPYVGQTLEKDSVESLVVNLRELDCTTFVENVLALSLCIKNKTTRFNDYCEMLVKLRYRNEKIEGYPSRLHYTTDWLVDNQQKGVLKIVSEDFGLADFDTKVDFMSTHIKSYRQLANPEFVKAMKEHEARISSYKLKFIPKNKINEVAKNIQDGDMIGISTNIPGLDFSHEAIAAWHNGKLYFIHASLKDKKVELSDKPLQDYLAGIQHTDGIVVARLNTVN